MHRPNPGLLYINSYTMGAVVSRELLGRPQVLNSIGARFGKWRALMKVDGGRVPTTSSSNETPSPRVDCPPGTGVISSAAATVLPYDVRGTWRRSPFPYCGSLA